MTEDNGTNAYAGPCSGTPKVSRDDLRCCQVSVSPIEEE